MSITARALRSVGIALVATLVAGVLASQQWAVADGSQRSSGERHASGETSHGNGKALTQRNKQIVRKFNELAFRDGKDAEALALVGDTYTNYEAGGVTTDRSALEGLLAAFPGDPNFELDAVIGEKDLVTVRYEAVFNGTSTIGIDIYRVVDGKIVEHWDSFALPTNGAPPGS